MQNNDIEGIKKQIARIGLTDKEADIYAYLLETGGAFPSKIAEATKINRSTVYKILLSLSIKGIVNEIEKSKKIFYQVEDPKKLARYAKDKVRLAEDQLEVAERLLPSLESVYSAYGNKPQVRYFEGPEGVQQIYEEHINVKRPYEMLAMSNADILLSILDTKFFTNYRQQKAKIGITTRGILPDTPENRKFNEKAYQQLNIAEKYWIQIGYIPQDKSHLPEGEITLYDGDKVSIVNFRNNVMSGTVIKDQVIFNMMKTFFELAWTSKDLKK